MSILFRLLLLSSFLAGLAFAQDRGSIRGTITDSSGAAVPEAKVAVQNVNTGLTQTAVTAPDGTYDVLYLPVGIYTVTTEKQGFRRGEAINVHVDVNTVSAVDMTLAVGSVDQKVEVVSKHHCWRRRAPTSVG